MEEWETTRAAQAKEIDVIDVSKRKMHTHTRTREKETEEVQVEGGAAVSLAEEREEEEEEYVPIDAMFRDELDVTAADGTNMRGYLVSSKMAQKFWRREERPVVLLLTDEKGW
jgi:hypothetical protein